MNKFLYPIGILNKTLYDICKYPTHIKYWILKNRIPSEYQEVKYIETDGNCYIDTEEIFTNNYSVKLKFRTGNTIPENLSTTLFYSGYSTNLYGFAITSSQASGKYRAIYKTAFTSNEKLEPLTDYEINFQKNKFYLNGNLVNTFANASFTLPYPLPLFAQYYGTQTAINRAGAGTRLYYCKFYDGNNLVKNFIPCYKKSNNEVGLYDTIKKKFYGNDGTGEFTYDSNE